MALGSNPEALFGLTSDRLVKWLPELYAGSIAGAALLGLLSLLGSSTSRWLAWLTGTVGAVTLLALPVGVVALSGTTDLEAGRSLAYRLSAIYAPLLLFLTGTRDYLAERIKAAQLAAAGD